MRALTGAAGFVTNSYDYDAYGNIEASFEGIANPFTYTGRERDAESGLYYYRARYYDPATGKFLAEDPLGFAAGDFNLSRYVFNNPVNLTDPSGEVVPQLFGGCVLGAAIEAGGQLVGNGGRLGCLDFGSIASECVVGAAIAVGAGPAVSFLARGLGGTGRVGRILGRLLKDQSGAVRISRAVRRLDPKKIRFTQDSIKRKSSNKKLVRTMIDQLKANPSKANSIKPIRIFEKEGKIFTLDNRRLLAFQQAGVPIRTVQATARELRKELPEKFTTINEGLSVIVRGGL